MERPDVDQITGLSPVIAIEQKTTNKNPRSTVGTVTELYDFCACCMQELGRPIVTIPESPWLNFPKQKSFKILPRSLRTKKLIYWHQWYVVVRDITASYLRKLEKGVCKSKSRWRDC